MPRALGFLLLAALLALALPAGAADLVLVNHSRGPITVALINPCGENRLPLVQVDANSSASYDLPACPSGKPEPGEVRLAVFDRRSDPPGFLAMLIAAKAYVRPPAKVIIERQHCKNCDTRYKIEWIPLKKK